MPYNFFPPNGTGPNDNNGYQAAILSGTLIAPSTQTISFGIGADDSAFAYLDGNLVCSLGGVHGFSYGSCVTPFNIAAGPHSLLVFFDDLNAVQSGFYFDVTTANVVTNEGVPAPGALALMGLGLAALGGIRRRKRTA